MTTRCSQPATGIRGGAGVRRCSGFTLLEVIIALALMITLMAGVYGFYADTMKARDTAIRSMRDTLLMRALLEQVADELRHISDVVPDNIGFSGTEEEITFVRLRMPDMGAAYAEINVMSEDPRPGQQDMVRVTYKLQWDDTGENMDEDGTPVCYGMLRSQQTPIDPNPGYVLSAEEMAKYEEDGGFSLSDDEQDENRAPPVAAELIAPEIKYLKFEYFDGAEWYDRWQVVSEDEGEAGAGAEGGEALDGGSTGGGGSGDGGVLSGGGLGGGGSGSGALGGGSGLGSGGSGGAMAGGGQQGYVLPQAIRVTIGKVKVPRLEDEFDISRAAEEEELDKRTYHPDRWTVTIYLRQADPSQLSSRKYAIDNDISGEGAQIGEQTEGGGR